MLRIILLHIFSLIFISKVYCLDNGLALTPPMGWMTWERFRCTTDCILYPKECISEDLIISMAYSMKVNGFLSAGYNTIIIDDCWLNKSRASDGSLIPDPIRFPNGMFYLGSIIHALGLKFGIYEDYGTKTCAGYPGSLNYIVQDIKTFVSWGVDYVKLDGCYSNISTQPEGYASYSHFLNSTKRPIVFSCSWPAYWNLKDITPMLADLLQKSCNLWRLYYDIDDNWLSVLGIIQFYKTNSYLLSQWAGPGHWNDPDMIVVGNSGLNYDQQRVQMGMWAIFAAPLIMSNDLRNISSDSTKLLQNKNIIKINQDVLGQQGYFISESNSVQIWRRNLSNNQSVIAVLNTANVPKTVYFSLQNAGFINNKEYSIADAFTQIFNITVGLTTKIQFNLNPTGIELMMVT